MDNYDEVEMDVDDLTSTEEAKLEIFHPQNQLPTTVTVTGYCFTFLLF